MVEDCTIAKTYAPDITTSTKIWISRRSFSSGRFKYGWNRSLASVAAETSVAAAAVTILADSAPAQKNATSQGGTLRRTISIITASAGTLWTTSIPAKPTMMNPQPITL